MTPDGFHTRSIAGGQGTNGNGRGRLERRPAPRSQPQLNARRARMQQAGVAGNALAAKVMHAWRWLVRQKRELGWPAFLARVGGVGALVALLYMGFLWFTLPSLDDPASLLASQSTVITDRNGTELYRLYSEQDRTYVQGSAIAPTMQQAIVAIEDARFHNRGCVDVRALARVVFKFGQSGGASTLTRQLARNALNLQQENILSRKLKELILGCQMEARFSKEKILELYLNWVPFGANAYGVEQASRRFLGKSAKDLTLAESAVLASLPQLPSYYSPYGRHVRTSVSQEILDGIAAGTITSSTQIDDDDVNIGLMGAMAGTGSKLVYVGGRSDQVLFNMKAQGMITEEQRQQAIDELKTLTFKPTRESIRAPHFVLWTRDQVERTFQGTADKGILEQGGLHVQTTLDWNLQKAAQDVVAKHAANAAKVYGAHNIALIAMDPRTKEILAYVGNVDYTDEEHEGKVDMALVPRQPGSSFKPLVYAGSFLKGYSPATVLHDVKTKFGTYEPQNFEGGFWGLTTIRKALGGSRNIPAVKAYFLAGEEDTLLDLVESMGAPTPKKTKPREGYGPSMAIGTAETPLIEMVQAYATLADGGKYKPAVSIVKITDRRGSLLPLPGTAVFDDEGKEVIDPRVAYQVTSILSDKSVRPGEYWANILSVPGTAAAAKTGTSNKCLERDARQNCTKRKPDNVWTMGYTPNLVVGVWVGNATSEPLSDRADGINVAAPIWKDFMTQAMKIMKPTVTEFRQPDGMVQVQASLLSGELPTECTPVDMRKSDVFLKENAPTKPDPACVTLMVDKVTGLLASDSCPAEAQEKRSFYAPYIPQAFASRFPQWEEGVRAWAAGGGLPLPIVPTESCDISKTPGRLVRPSVTLISPTSTATYPSFQANIEYKTGSGVLKVEYEIDGKPAGTFTAAPFDGAIRVPRSIDASGTHRLTVTLTDSYYNEVTDSATIRFEGDSSGPGITVTSPAAGTELTQDDEVSIAADADDTEGGIKYVEFYLDDLLLTRKPVTPYSLSYPLKDVSPGRHSIRAVAVDLAGNTAQDSVFFTVKAEGNESGDE